MLDRMAFRELPSMTLAPKGLLPPIAELAKLDSRTAKLVLEYIDRENARSTHYSTFGMASGLMSFLACIGSFTFLVIHGHAVAAGVILAPPCSASQDR